METAKDSLSNDGELKEPPTKFNEESKVSKEHAGSNVVNIPNAIQPKSKNTLQDKTTVTVSNNSTSVAASGDDDNIEGGSKEKTKSNNEKTINPSSIALSGQDKADDGTNKHVQQTNMDITKPQTEILTTPTITTKELESVANDKTNSLEILSKVDKKLKNTTSPTINTGTTSNTVIDKPSDNNLIISSPKEDNSTSVKEKNEKELNNNSKENTSVISDKSIALSEKKDGEHFTSAAKKEAETVSNAKKSTSMEPNISSKVIIKPEIDSSEPNYINNKVNSAVQNEKANNSTAVPSKENETHSQGNLDASETIKAHTESTSKTLEQSEMTGDNSQLKDDSHVEKDQTKAEIDQHVETVETKNHKTESQHNDAASSTESFDQITATVIAESNPQQGHDTHRSDDNSLQGKVNGREADSKPSQGNGEVNLQESESLRLLEAGCRFDVLPPLPKKVVRIFVSSTFTDTKEERNALMQHVYPKLSDYCREKHGLEFQIVDMRWGVPEQASDNHTTTELCIQEIKKCQQVSAGPNFVAIVGDKYGYRPIPNAIDCDVFNALKMTSPELTDDWQLVEEWYKQDTNATPIVYILQPISTNIEHYQNKDDSELRRAAWNKWNSTNQTLTRTLRKAATLAHQQGQIQDKQKQLFFMSVTENEITSGVIDNVQKTEEACYIIIRKISDLDQHLSEKTCPRFADVTDTSEIDNEAQQLLKELRDVKLSTKLPESNLTKLDIEWSASGAAVSIEQFKDVDVVKYAQKMLSDKEMVAYKHKEYLDKICTDFFKKICKLVNQGSMKQIEMYDELSTELLQHYHLAKLRCDMFEGREDILAVAKAYINDAECSHPLVIYGHSGCGKTSVMAKIMEHVANNDWKQEGTNPYVIITRFLGTTSKTSNVHQLMVTMCMQLSKLFQKKWEEPEQFSELVKSFYQLLENATSSKPIILLLDSIDQLMPVYNAYKLDWLPDEFPPHVKVVASTIDEGYPILDSFREKYQSLECIEVKPLGEKLGMTIIRKWLEKDGRTMTSQQADVIKAALLKCSLPLYARIAYDHIRKWKSYDMPTLEQLETTVKGAINKLYQYMEDKFGQVVVKHCLAYLTASRHGLSEAELEHILSLDDALLNKVFRLWKPPIRRIPPLIWTRIRAEIHSYIVERSADDTLVLYWYHRQFIQTTRARYLQDEEFSKHVTDHLVEYFSGEWSRGKEKPFKYTDAQMKRFQLESCQSSADRKVPAQPYWTENKTLTESTVRYNKRKLSELPFHLLKKKNYEQLKAQTFFSYEWLYAKVKSTSAQQMLEEIDIFMQANKYLKKDSELKLLYVNLQLIRPYIIHFPDSLSYELTGRLSKYLGKYPNITTLLKECDSKGNEHCPLLPLTTCFETAGLGFTQNIIFRKTEPWHRGGTFTSDSKYIYIIDYNDEGLPILLTWDIASGEKINQIPIKKTKDESNKFTTDLYFQADIVNNGKWILACYKQRMDATFKKQIQPGGGFIDVIELDSGNVKTTYDNFMYRDEFFDPIIYLTPSYVCHTLGWKKPLINIITETKQNYNRPTLLSQNEKYFIMCGKEQTELREYETKGLIGVFDVSESQIGVAASEDFRTIAMLGSETKQIKVFDLLNKKMEAKESAHNLIKSKQVFKLDEKTSLDIAIVFKPILETNKEGRIQEKTNNRVVMKLSSNAQQLMVSFIGWKWMTFLWTIWSPGRYSARFVGPVTPFRMPCTYKLPIFNFDGSALVYAKKRKVLIVSTVNVEVINEYEMKEDIKDIQTSVTSNKVAVMLQKSIMLLDIGRSQSDEGKGKLKALEANTNVLFQREIVKDVIQKEIVYKAWEENIELEQIDDLVVGMNTDRITSATTRLKHALSKYVTPNGQRAVHFHRRAQVIDTKNEMIKYTPKSGDRILRTIISADGQPANEVIQIPGIDPTVNAGIALTLKQGDRVVNNENKIKFRVNKEPSGIFLIMVVPSVITTYTTEELKLRKLRRITVFQEQILDVSNSLIVTAKIKSSGNFVNIYNQHDGKLLATHDMPSSCECAKFSFDEIQLFAADRSLTVKVFQGPTFTSTEAKISLMEGQISSAFVVKDLVHFPKNRECLLVRYGPEGPDVYVKSRYLFFNMITHEKSNEMAVTPAFGDISADGKYAIDNSLKVYDLKLGQVISKLDYNRALAEDERERQLQVVMNRRMAYVDLSASLLLCMCITDDGYIVYINRQDNTLHVHMMTGRKTRHLVSCFTHANDLLAKGLTVRCNEKVIILTTPSNTTAIAINRSKTTNFNYQGELSRALAIVQNIEQLEKSSQKQIEQPQSTNVFFKRKALLQQIESEQAAQNKERNLNPGDAHKPSVLVVGEPILCTNIFNGDSFSPNLHTQKMSVQNVNDALTKLKEDHFNYDVIILQLITNDVTMYDAEICVKKLSIVIELAREKARIVVLSLAPVRTDNKEFNDRINKVNEKLCVIYASSCGNGKHLHICKNQNMSDNGKPVTRYFKDSVTLSAIGLKKMCRNFKDVLAPLLGIHHI